MTATGIQYPKLRATDVRPFVRDGRSFILLRDPLQLTDKSLLVPQSLAPVLALCDGTRENSQALQASLAVRFGLRVPPDVIAQLLSALDKALLLENTRYIEARDHALARYRLDSFRPPSLAGSSYPADQAELVRTLQGYLEAAGGAGAPVPDAGYAVGLVSPHIDYDRGGPVYARVWQRAAKAIRVAEVVVILGTDHYGEDAQLTLTRQNYATPFGVLPTAQPVVDALTEVMGTEAAFAGELRHRGEHSIELAAVWLHYIREGRPCDLVPILCGSFSHFIQDGADPDQELALEELGNALNKAAAGRPVVVVAAGDLAHVGPAFGGPALDRASRTRLQASDEELIQRMCAGDAAGFLGAIRQAGDENNVCGVPPIYLALRLLGQVRGELVAYDHCPADEEDTSVVSVCGLVFE